MKVVWKYGLKLCGLNRVEMACASKLLSVQCQAGKLCLWALADIQPTHLAPREFYVVNTGDSFDSEGMEFVGTVQFPNGVVHHVFEVIG